MYVRVNMWVLLILAKPFNLELCSQLHANYTFLLHSPGMLRQSKDNTYKYFSPLYKCSNIKINKNSKIIYANY